MKHAYELIPLSGEVMIQAALRLFLSNPAYFKLTRGDAADRTDVLLAMTEKPEQVPPERKHTSLIQRFSGGQPVPVAVVDWLEGFPEPGMIYLGLFMTDALLHGSGESWEILDWLLEGFRKDRTRAVRLGVIEQNQRALRFWQRAGFSEVRRMTHTSRGSVHEVVIMDLTFSQNKNL